MYFWRRPMGPTIAITRLTPPRSPRWKPWSRCSSGPGPAPSPTSRPDGPSARRDGIIKPWRRNTRRRPRMEYRTLGTSSLRVSAVGLGSNSFGLPRLDEAAVQRVLHAALDHGINFIDTAPIYTEGQSEELI